MPGSRATPFNEVLIIRLYHQIINLLIDPDNPQAYLELRSLLLKQGNNLLIDDKRQLYFLCANHEMWRTKNARLPNSLQLFFTFKEMVKAVFLTSLFHIPILQQLLIVASKTMKLNGRKTL